MAQQTLLLPHTLPYYPPLLHYQRRLLYYYNHYHHLYLLTLSTARPISSPLTPLQLHLHSPHTPLIPLHSTPFTCTPSRAWLFSNCPLLPSNSRHGPTTKVHYLQRLTLKATSSTRYRRTVMQSHTLKTSYIPNRITLCPSVNLHCSSAQTTLITRLLFLLFSLLLPHPAATKENAQHFFSHWTHGN